MSPSLTQARRPWRFSSRTIADALVVDVFLPDINGVEVCRRIKANERTAEGAYAASAELLDLIVSMTGLSELVARSSVESACRRLAVDPKTLTRKDIPRVVEGLERTLQLFLPEPEARHRIAALTARAR
ncbi:MAG TPA: hypothetical protein VIV60_35135 [Polyangiaceae bacterium]